MATNKARSPYLAKYATEKDWKPETERTVMVKICISLTYWFALSIFYTKQVFLLVAWVCVVNYFYFFLVEHMWDVYLPDKDLKADIFKGITVFCWAMVNILTLTSVFSFDKLCSRSSRWTLTVSDVTVKQNNALTLNWQPMSYASTLNCQPTSFDLTLNWLPISTISTFLIWSYFTRPSVTEWFRALVLAGTVIGRFLSLDGFVLCSPIYVSPFLVACLQTSYF